MNTPTLPNTFYRFRSIDALLDKYHELENQTIYFASPEELNDPMEGFRDIVWRGDSIVWTRLLKNYVDCLHGGYLLPRMRGGPKELDVNDLPILGRWNLIPEGQGLFDDFWHRFYDLPYIREIIEALSSSSRGIRYRELRYYLRLVQFIVLQEISKFYTARGVMPQSAPYQRKDALRNQASLRKILATINRLEHETEEECNATLQKFEAMDDSQRLYQQRQHNSTSKVSSEVLRKNNQLVIFDFPILYLKEFGRKLWPKWYTACFTQGYHNSSVWGNYADKHKGACLIFETVNIAEFNCLHLHPVTNEGVRTVPFFKVNYAKRPDEIDAFRYIGNLASNELIKLWFTDEDGIISKCVDNFQSGTDKGDYQKKYRDSFYRDVITKTKDWKYEREWRLILDNLSAGFDVEKNRALKYDFNSLKGIIFGVNTSDKHKTEIIDIIERKCNKHKRTDFKYYQAYYSPETGDIRKYEIQLS